LQAFDLSGKTALIAGASRGIGLAIAKLTAEAGAHTILASRSLDTLQKEANELKDKGFSAEAMAMDVSSAQKIRDFAAKLPDVDILVNVAGMNLRKRFEDYTEEEYSTIMQTNLHGIFQLTQLVGKKMIDRAKGGKIIMIGSLTTVHAFPYLGVYATTKAALGGMTRVLAAEWGRYNIQVNCIAPGFILTDLNRKMWEPKEMHDWLQASQANPRMGTPEDIAPLSVFLSASGSDYITGQVIPVDGGFVNTSNWPFQPAG
jgi:gluconate 5-dehydrogenase